MNILFSESAIQDLEQIKEYYTEQHVPQVGQDFVVAIVDQIETLRTHPDIGRKVPEFNDKLIRELIHPPFRIVYTPESMSINIIRVWRSERLLTLEDENPDK